MSDGYWLTTDRLGLRRFTPDDLDWLLELHSDADVTRYLDGVKTRAQIEELLHTRILQYYDEHPGLGVWATVDRTTGARLGLHLLNHIRGESIIQVGFTLAKSAWGKGYGTEMAYAVLRYGFADLKLPHIAGIASLKNHASQRVLTKIGLERRGERAFPHPAYAAEGPLAWFERDAGAWLAEHVPPARDIAAGDAGAIGRAVSTRLGNGLEPAATQARRAIHDNDVERLKQLLAEYPALLSWQEDDDHGGLLGFATGAYGDAGDPERERWFTRAACAELLIDAGGVVTPYVLNGLLDSRARELLQLFQQKGLLPRTLKFFAALGDLDGVRAALNENGTNLKTVNEAFVCACRFAHEAVASLVLERSIALDPELGTNIDGHTDRLSFIRCFNRPDRSDFAQVAALGLWKVFVMGQVQRALDERDLAPFVGELQREPWLLGDAYVAFQAGLIETASFQIDREEFIRALLDLDPAILRRQPPPPSRAIEWAVMYANTHLLPLLTRIWRVPDDLPYAAGMGNLARVKQWFDSAGVVRNLDAHYPYNDPHARGHLRWDPPTAQQVLDVALAFAVINRHFDVADFLLEHGADINTRWNSHEPASILHHLVFLPNSHESMRFLVDRGIDLTIRDYRWDATAQGWARHAAKDEKMAQWLEEAERQREQGR